MPWKLGVGPYSFEDEGTGQALTELNKERYTDMLIQIFPEGSEDVDSEAIFQ